MPSEVFQNYKKVTQQLLISAEVLGATHEQLKAFKLQYGTLEFLFKGSRWILKRGEAQRARNYPRWRLQVQ